MWHRSAGVCLFAMLATTLPFSGDEDSAELVHKVCAGVWDATPEVSAHALDLLRGMLAVAADERRTLDEVCEHAWLEGQPVPWQGTDE